MEEETETFQLVTLWLKTEPYRKSYRPVKWRWLESKAIVVFQEVGNGHDDRMIPAKALAKMSDPFS